MVSDWGTQFNKKFLQHLYKHLGMKPSFSSAYHVRKKWGNYLTLVIYSLKFGWIYSDKPQFH